MIHISHSTRNNNITYFRKSDEKRGYLITYDVSLNLLKYLFEIIKVIYNHSKKSCFRSIEKKEKKYREVNSEIN